jgi:prepilin-type N-terminal cleavage/methylation domain-containing protein
MQKLLNSLRSSKGFTLIELLIVIAVLGVLAAVVITAINPAEQLKRGRDSSRLQQIAQLGHAAAAYYTAQGTLLSTNTSYTSANWQTILVTSSDIQQAINPPTGTPACAIPAGSSAQNSICYKPNGTTDFLVWMGVESGLYTTKAAGAIICTSGNSPYFIYDSTQGKAGVACASTANGPSAGVTLN